MNVVRKGKGTSDDDKFLHGAPFTGHHERKLGKLEDEQIGRQFMEKDAAINIFILQISKQH